MGYCLEFIIGLRNTLRPRYDIELIVTAITGSKNCYNFFQCFHRVALSILLILRSNIEVGPLLRGRYYGVINPRTIVQCFKTCEFETLTFVLSIIILDYHNNTKLSRLEVIHTLRQQLGLFQIPSLSLFSYTASCHHFGYEHNYEIITTYQQPPVSNPKTILSINFYNLCACSCLVAVEDR